jgi:ABC-type phosphate/phosphonate transport system substrate-binding protein
LFPKVDFRDAKASIELWTREIISDMKKYYSFQNLFIANINSVDNFFIEEKIDFITMSSLEYIINNNKLKSLNPVMISSSENDMIGVEYIILVHKGNNISSLGNLENQTIAFVDDYSNAIPQIWLDVLLKSKRLPLSSKFFKSIEISNNSNQAILKTFFKQVQACVVPKILYEASMELNPQISRDLIVLEQSKPFIVGVMCVHNKVENDLKVDIIQSAKNVLASEKGRQFAIFFRSGELIDFKTEHLDNVNKLVADAIKFNINLNRD